MGDTEDRARFVARLRETIKSFGSANSLANTAGVSEGALRKWASGVSEPTRDRLVAIARAAGVNVSWLATGSGARDRTGGGELPVLEGFTALENVTEQGTDQDNMRRIAFSQEWLEHNAPSQGPMLATIQAPDDSMSALIPAGAELVIDRTTGEVNRDGIYALRVDGALLVRRLQRIPGGFIEASSETGTYQPFRFQMNDPAVSVIGRVIWVGRDL